MDISKINEITKNLPKVEPLPLKYGESKTEYVKEMAKKLGLPVKEYGLPDISDFGDEIEGLPEIDEKAKKVEFDTNAFFAAKGNKNVVMFLDEISINGITGETFTNGENN